MSTENRTKSFSFESLGGRIWVPGRLEWRWLALGLVVSLAAHAMLVKALLWIPVDLTTRARELSPARALWTHFEGPSLYTATILPATCLLALAAWLQRKQDDRISPSLLMASLLFVLGGTLGVAALHQIFRFGVDHFPDSAFWISIFLLGLSALTGGWQLLRLCWRRSLTRQGSPMPPGGPSDSELALHRLSPRRGRLLATYLLLAGSLFAYSMWAMIIQPAQPRFWNEDMSLARVDSNLCVPLSHRDRVDLTQGPGVVQIDANGAISIDGASTWPAEPQRQKAQTEATEADPHLTPWLVVDGSVSFQVVNQVLDMATEFTIPPCGFHCVVELEGVHHSGWKAGSFFVGTSDRHRKASSPPKLTLLGRHRSPSFLFGDAEFSSLEELVKSLRERRAREAIGLELRVAPEVTWSEVCKLIETLMIDANDSVVELGLAQE